MVGLTYTPPLVPAAQGLRALGQPEASPYILSILSGAAAGAVGDSLSDTLAVATGPGNILTGTVTSTSPNGNFTLTTAADAELTLHYPPELPIDIGSLVTLRIATTGLTPQAQILSIDGRPVSIQGPVTAPPSVVPASPGAASAIAPAGGGLLPGTGNASAYAASVSALLDLDLLTTTGATETPATANGSALGPTIATLLRPAAVGYGQQPLSIGTRYLLSLSQDLPAGSEAVPDAETALPPEFLPQSANVTGRVMPPLRFGEVILDTPLGTLALDTDESIAVGTSIRLSIAAVAPPLTAASAVAPTADASLIDEALSILTMVSPPIAARAAENLVLPTGGMLLATAWQYLTDSRTRLGAKDALNQMRKALIDIGRTDLADRLETGAGNVGEAMPQRIADGWIVSTLPFLGLASQEPVRLYVRGDDGNGGDNARDRGERLIVEVKLMRLGPMQFEGLARDRRLDLVVRTTAPLELGLVQAIESGFRDAIESCGSAGEISFGKLTRFPFMQADHAEAAITFEA